MAGESAPGDGAEGGVEAGQVEGPGTAVAADELASVFTHATLVVVTLHLDTRAMQTHTLTLYPESAQ